MGWDEENPMRSVKEYPKEYEIWLRAWLYCPDCKMSWFEEGGQESTCVCEDGC
jgi:hypothetical protein